MLQRTNLDKSVSDVLLRHDFRKNSFFQTLSNGEMSKEEFVQTQQQFYYAVIHFTSPLALVAAAIPSYEERVNIIKNLWEEHGEGNMAATHGSTFTELLKRLTSQEVPYIPPASEEVLLFNQTLDGICKNSHYLKGVAMIGTIERMFADISSCIGSAIVKRGWLTQDQVVHYAIHEKLDCIHAEDFFSILRPHYDDEHNKQVIDEGLNLGGLVFLQLYHNLKVKVKGP